MFNELTRTWIQRHVTSVEQLDLLLLLDADRSRFWSVDNAASVLRLSRAAVRGAAEVLAARNFLEVRFGEDVLYRLDPGSPDLQCLVDRVAEVMRRDRGEAVRVLGLGRGSPGMMDLDARAEGADDVGGDGPHA